MLPTFLVYIVQSTRGFSPCGPPAVMSTTTSRSYGKQMNAGGYSPDLRHTHTRSSITIKYHLLIYLTSSSPSEFHLTYALLRRSPFGGRGGSPTQPATLCRPAIWIVGPQKSSEAGPCSGAAESETTSTAACSHYSVKRRALA
jgi:hypothetical protein